MASEDAVQSGTTHDRGQIPAYGPIDAVLGYVVFYVFVDRATPTIVEVMTAALTDVSPSLFRLGTAAALWFILVVTTIDQLRRQLAALGVGDRDRGSRDGGSRVILIELPASGHLLVLLGAGLIAAWTFEPAIRAGIMLIRVVGTLDVSSFVPLDVLMMIVFFVTFASATRALDRLIINGIRTYLGE